MGDNNVGQSKKSYQDMMQEYVSIQKAAYTSQSAKSSAISQLKEEFASYFDQNKDAASNRDKVLGDLGQMQSMAEAHEKDPTHTDNNSWDELRTEMDSLIKQMAPKGTDTSAIDQIPRGGGSASGMLSGISAKFATANFNGVGMISLDQMAQKFPQLAPYKDAINKAAEKYGLPPQLLAAQAMQESHANPSEKGGGMFQFIPSTWSSLGGGNYSFSAANIEQQAMMAAKYDSQLLQQHGGDLNSMLREYNGPVAAGGNSQYQTQISKWMRGVDGYQG